MGATRLEVPRAAVDDDAPLVRAHTRSVEVMARPVAMRWHASAIAFLPHLRPRLPATLGRSAGLAGATVLEDGSASASKAGAYASRASRRAFDHGLHHGPANVG